MAEIENLDGMDGSIGRFIAIRYQRRFANPGSVGPAFSQYCVLVGPTVWVYFMGCANILFLIVYLPYKS